MLVLPQFILNIIGNGSSVSKEKGQFNHNVLDGKSATCGVPGYVSVEAVLYCMDS